MSRYYYQYRPEKREDPDARSGTSKKNSKDFNPVTINGKLASSWWAQSWNENLESYADYSNRIGRGRSYVRKGAVIDLSITPGKVKALVQGSRSRPYQVTIDIDPFPEEKWDAMMEHCSHKIASLEELVSGRFPREFTELFTERDEGLFPSPKEIGFKCSCPDWASMCKHVAATLYGVGARFDEDPTLFFLLRNINFTDLLKKSVSERMDSMLKNAGKTTSRVIEEADTSELFGI